MVGAVKTFVEHQKRQVAQVDECVINGIGQDLVSRDYHIDIL